MFSHQRSPSHCMAIVLASAWLLPVPSAIAQTITLQSANEVATGQFGYSVASVPDVSGDGNPDVVVGARIEDHLPMASNAGRAYIFDGITGALRTTLVSPALRSDGNFGFTVAGIADLNGDGHGEVIVGAPNDGTPAPAGDGRVYVYDGDVTGTNDTPIATLRSPTPESGGEFGWSVAATQDANLDGKNDIVIGADGEAPGGQSNAGRAYLWSGATTGASQTPLATLVMASPEADARFGYAVAGGDFNFDARGDVIVGAPYANPGGAPANAGRVFIYSGGIGGTNSTPIATLISPNEEDGGNLGIALAGAADFNGDSIDDVVVSAPFEIFPAGRVYLYAGSVSGGTISTVLRTLTSPNGGNANRFGLAVDAGPDLDNDGQSDLIVGAFMENLGNLPSGSGAAYVFSGFSGTLLHTVASPNAETNGSFGTAVAFTGLTGIVDPQWIVGAALEDPGASPDDAGRAYLMPPPPDVKMNEIRIDQPSGAGGDVDEYFELVGPAAADLSDLTYLVIGDAGPTSGGSGVIEAALSLTGQTIPAGGYFLAAEDMVFEGSANPVNPQFLTGLNFENSDNVTHLLVRGFFGTVGQDLDPTDVGTFIAAPPWYELVDCVAVLEDAQIGDRVYCGTTVGPFVGASRNFSPGHVYRLPDATGTWQMGPFDPVVGDDTPGAANAIATGACCNGSTCTPNMTQSACTTLGHTWMGPDSVCSPNACEGACCNPANGTCSLRTKANCLSLGRWFRGGGTVCADVDCGCDGNVVLNEIWASDPVNDDVEYIELYMPPCGASAAGAGGRGPPTYSLAGMSLIIVDGDTEGDPNSNNFKSVTYRADFTSDHSIEDGGFVVIGSIPCAPPMPFNGEASPRGCTPPVLDLMAGTFENHSQTYALVRTQDLAFCANPSNPVVPPNGCQNDVDSHRLTDGSVTAIAANQIDTVATTDTNPGDHSYFSAPVVKDGIFQATQLQRTVDGNDTDQTADWEVQHLEEDDPGSTFSPGLDNTAGAGACCNGASCSVETQADCASLGRIYRGNGTDCSVNLCAGACCVAGSCTGDQTPAACAGAGGAYMGDGITCAEVNCNGINIGGVGGAKALGPGKPVILNDAVVTSIDDTQGHPGYKAFQIRSFGGGGNSRLTVFGKNAEIDALLNGPPVLATGDTIDLAGTTDQWNGLFQLTSDIAPFKVVQYQDTNSGIGSLTLSAADFQDGSATAEANESRIAVLECMAFIDGGTGLFEADQSYLATDGSLYVSIFIPASSTGLVGTPIPTGSRRLRGIFWQSDFNLPTDTAPDNSGYRLVLRTSGDILSPICVDPQGACCVPSGGCVCSQTTQALCEGAGGLWIGGTCSPSTLCANQPSRLEGDIDGDGDIDFADVGYFALAIVGNPAQPAHAVRADLDCSGAANGGDIPEMMDAMLP